MSTLSQFDSQFLVSPPVPTSSKLVESKSKIIGRSKPILASPVQVSKVIKM